MKFIKTHSFNLVQIGILFFMAYANVHAASPAICHTIDNRAKFGLDIISTNCPISKDISKIDSGTTLTFCFDKDMEASCIIRFGRDSHPKFSLIYIKGYPFIPLCKNKAILSQPGYRCELTKDGNQHTLTINATHTIR